MLMKPGMQRRDHSIGSPRISNFAQRKDRLISRYLKPIGQLFLEKALMKKEEQALKETQKVKELAENQVKTEVLDESSPW